MPIALPTPAAPVLGSAEALRSGGVLVTAAHHDVQVHVVGPDVVSKEQLREAITGADNLSDAVRRIQSVYYVAGYPAARVVYAPAQSNLYVQVSLGKISRVEAPEPYEGYLSGLAGINPLTDDDLEPRRAMASLHADRAGQNAIPSFIPDGQDFVLRVVPTNDGPDRSTAGLGFGNPGNRFVGRYFVDWFARHAFATGDELRATGLHGVEGFDQDERSNGYNEYSLGWSRVSPRGLMSLNGRYVGYQQNLSGTALDGDVREADAGWTGLLAADYFSRWTVGAKVGYTHNSLAAPASEIIARRQEYGSAELSTQYSLMLRASGVGADLGADLALRGGLGDDKTDRPQVAADLGYRLYRLTLTARIGLGGDYALDLAATGQISSDTLPDQQQWVIGGIGNVEAYLPGVASGDTGGLVRLQMERAGYEVWGVKVQPRLFVEYGMARYESPTAQQTPETQSVADAGVSLGLSSGPFEVSVSCAKPFAENNIDQAVLDKADASVFFRVAGKF